MLLPVVVPPLAVALPVELPPLLPVLDPLLELPRPCVVPPEVPAAAVLEAPFEVTVTVYLASPDTRACKQPVTSSAAIARAAGP